MNRYMNELLVNGWMDTMWQIETRLLHLNVQTTFSITTAITPDGWVGFVSSKNVSLTSLYSCLSHLSIFLSLSLARSLFRSPVCKCQIVLSSYLSDVSWNKLTKWVLSSLKNPKEGNIYCGKSIQSRYPGFTLMLWGIIQIHRNA